MNEVYRTRGVTIFGNAMVEVVEESFNGDETPIAWFAPRYRMLAVLMVRRLNAAATVEAIG